MKDIKISMNFSNCFYIEPTNSGYYPSEKVKYNIGFPFDIKTDNWSINTIIKVDFPMDTHLDNSKIKRNLLGYVIDELKEIFANRSKIDVFDRLNCYPDKEKIIGVLNNETKDYFEFPLQITEVLFTNLEEQSNEIKNIERTYDRTTNFLSEILYWQLENEKDSISTCFRFLNTCLRSSFDNVDSLSELHEIEYSFLKASNISHIENSKMKLFLLNSPRLFRSKPDIPQELYDIL
jgi:hypothetical protein